ncbi:hypothetical protein Pelo_6112 [Pelomyxa schiedti]|nr:hypothetical protein Pelo_6112 [Pelomyxa schiedti]
MLPNGQLSDIKLKRTDTTLDLSQKAEKLLLTEKLWAVWTIPRTIKKVFRSQLHGHKLAQEADPQQRASHVGRPGCVLPQGASPPAEAAARWSRGNFFDKGDCRDLCNPGCPDRSIGNRQCDSWCMTEECNYDGGDCGDWNCAAADWGNGMCDWECANADCAWDGGDCLH